jgi:hypothetical protein
MKYLIRVLAAVFCAVLAAPAFAQSPQAEAEFQRFLANHPDVRADPGLLSDKNYLYHHPNIATFLEQHPTIHQQAFMMGAYDRTHMWRDSNWWYRHDPNWTYQNHPEWFRAHPEWRAPVMVAPAAGVGDYDEHHQWHDKAWWMAHNRQWAEQHHPEWAQHREEQRERHEEHHEHHDHN